MVGANSLSQNSLHTTTTSDEHICNKTLKTKPMKHDHNIAQTYSETPMKCNESNITNDLDL